MEHRILNGGGVLREDDSGKVEVDVPYREGVTFSLPLVRIDTYKRAMESLDSKKLDRATTAQVLSLVSLVDVAQQNPGIIYFDNLHKIMKHWGLWSCTETFSVSKKMVVYDNAHGNIPRKKTDLLRLIGLENSGVRGGDEEGLSGEVYLSEVLKHPYTVMNLEEDGLEIFERVARRVDSSDNPKVKVYGFRKNWNGAHLYSMINIFEDKLVLKSCSKGEEQGCAYGLVRKIQD